jgi:membrane protein implicated in regulation of membrane protease activity
MSWSPPVVWSVAGLVLIALEAVHPAFVLVFFGVGALITALVSLVFDISSSHQLVLFAVASIATLFFLRRWLKNIFYGHSRAAQKEFAALQSFIGIDGEVTEAIVQNGEGRIKVRGSFYTAVSDQPIRAGERARIVEDPRGDHSVFKVVKI